MLIDLKDKISKWDGQSVDALDVIFSQSKETVNFSSELISLMDDVALQKGTTWLLKKVVEMEKQLGDEDSESLCYLLPKIDNWEARLHILQVFEYLNIPRECKYLAEIFIREGLKDTNKFIRAWAYSAFYELATQFPEYRSEVLSLLDEGMEIESPSVKARIKNILKKSR
ncbi:MAG: hypothetical protein OQJ97_07460 [Rhodospirillales bacterium]|nr:hypothetical protein [Rhodospirillales bacterium]